MADSEIFTDLVSTEAPPFYPDWNFSTLNENQTALIQLENATELPLDMRFNEGHALSVIVYSILFIISATGNLTVLCLLLQRRRGARSRINTMLLHLAIADLLVTFLLMPMEIAWAITVQWKGGDAMCRIMAFFRTFGLFLSSFVLVCISLDRYFAVLRPMSLMAVDKRGKIMLSAAWTASVVCSFPQIIIFHVEPHPKHTWYQQCVTFNAFPSERHEIAYAAFGMIMMYGLPLVVILFSYASIIAEIFRRTRDLDNDVDRIRRSSLGYLGKAKIRTLKMTIIIVVVFFVCWTPYYVMCLWYWYDRNSAAELDQRIQKGLFLFAVTNSCMNPIVYGAFNIRVRRAAQVSSSQRLRQPDTMTTSEAAGGRQWSPWASRGAPGRGGVSRDLEERRRPSRSAGPSPLWRRPAPPKGPALHGLTSSNRRLRSSSSSGPAFDPWDHLTPCPSATRL
ncbi:adipokinetic hormone/corazonin-related peptide receptor variant I-like isoform X2 [Neocloeon triangulifer]|uniref:adipokinetic hormone/corazonin-related peptide receptor variant I-like isoform X2 n=1 Tax=Neocloeon triangulifer TaxID=2078957 RepID=UPI00286F13BA|nr:adipokinetic hormone/corazonin-related peptide receptor variant I-like isoform X2 [Neocloeon triangulifer]